MESDKTYDLFISYRHRIGDGPEKRTAEVGAMATQLEEAGFSIFIDQSEIDVFEGFTPEVEAGIENSKALLVYFSNDYTKSQACMAEFRAMYIAAIQNGWDPRERIFVLNPEDNCNHFDELPVDLRDVNAALTAESAVENLQKSISILDDTFGRRGLHTRTSYYPSQLTGSERFVGRVKEMWEMHYSLNASEFPQTTGSAGYPDIAQVIGMGGLGKSLLAEEYSLRFGAAYPGGVFWLRANGSYNPTAPDIESFLVLCKEQLRVIAESLGLRLPQETTLEGFRYSIGQKIGVEGKRCLWVVDDVPTGLAGHGNAVKAWLSPSPLARTLITTRSHEYRNFGGAIPLEVLSNDQAKNLLKKHGIEITSQEEDTDDLLERLGGHSLALDIAGTAIKENGGHIHRLLEEIETDNDDLLNAPIELTGELPAGHQPSIVKTFKHSIDRLDEPGKDLLRIAANLSPEPIRDEFVLMIFRDTYGLNEKDSRRKCTGALRQAAQYSLINRRRNSLSGNSFYVHPLISASVRYLNMTANYRSKSLLSAAVAILSSIIGPQINFKESFLINIEISHARFLTGSVNEESDSKFLMLMIQLAKFDYSQGDFFSALKNWRQIVKIQQEKVGADHPDTLINMNNLGTTLSVMGDLEEARILQEEVLGKLRRILGSENLETLKSMCTLGSTLRYMGFLKEARNLYEEASWKLRKILGPEHPDFLTCINNLALTLYFMGESIEARNHFEEVLEKRLKILGPDHPDTLTSMNNLAGTLSEIGDFEGASVLHKEALEKRLKILGPDHPDTLTSMNNLGRALRAKGELAVARLLQEEALCKSHKILGPEHPNTALAAWNVFITLDRAESYTEAQRILQDELVWLLKEGLVLKDERLIQIREMIKENLGGNKSPHE